MHKAYDYDQAPYGSYQEGGSPVWGVGAHTATTNKVMYAVFELMGGEQSVFESGTHDDYVFHLNPIPVASRN